MPGLLARRRAPAASVLLAALLTMVIAGCGSATPDDDPPAKSDAQRLTPAASPEPAPAERPGSALSALNADLIDAAWKNDVDAARQLVEAGADVNAKDSTEQNLYLIATSEGYDELLEFALEHGADVGSLDSYRGTGLIRAAERGHAAVVGRLLQAGVAVDHVNRLGWTALHEAIILGEGDQRYVDTVRLLVAGGADLDLAPVQDGIAPLEHARARDQSRIVQTLSTAMSQAPVNADEALLEAAAAGDADAAARALRSGAQLETRDSASRTPLLLAAANDHLDVARMLVALGANPNAQDERQDTPWLVTGVTGSVAMLETLLAADPDFTVVNRFGGVSVIPASERGHVEYVRRVVQTAIDVNHVNNLGWTALLEAVILGDGSEPYHEIVRILLDAGADRDIGDNEGTTALQHARASGYTAIAGILEGA